MGTEFETSSRCPFNRNCTILSIKWSKACTHTCSSFLPQLVQVVSHVHLSSRPQLLFDVLQHTQHTHTHTHTHTRTHTRNIQFLSTALGHAAYMLPTGTQLYREASLIHGQIYTRWLGQQTVSYTVVTLYVHSSKP